MRTDKTLENQRFPQILFSEAFIFKASTSQAKKWRNYRQDKGEEKENTLVRWKGGKRQAGGRSVKKVERWKGG